MWEVKCDCGNSSEASTTDLTGGHKKSCGCLKKEVLGLATSTHGLSKTHPLYYTWEHMRRRCNSPKCKDYPQWGGRGITICPEWDDFGQFVKDVPEKPKGKYTLGRIDNNGNYKPGNIEWQTKTQQNRNNTRSLRVETVLKIKDAIKRGVPGYQIRKEFGVSVHVVYQIRNGKSWADVGT